MMKKKLTLLIFLFPAFIMAQDVKNGAITFDLHPKKDKPADTTQQQQTTSDDDDEQQKPKKQKKVRESSGPMLYTAADYKREGLFKAWFHAGVNGSQIDGDNYAGYNQIGLDAGVAALLRFHKYLAFSMSLDYSMKGARQQLKQDPNAPTLSKYQVQWDYLEVPIGLTINAVTPKNKQIMLITLGLAPAVMVRYKQFDEDGDNVTNNPPEGQPHRFDLSAFGGFYFVIHKNYAIGGKFSYSITKVRGPNLMGISRLLGEYNNDLTVDFMYILDTGKKGTRKRTNL